MNPAIATRITTDCPCGCGSARNLINVVGCPTCGAPAGIHCIRLREVNGHYLVGTHQAERHPHEERREAFLDYLEQRDRQGLLGTGR
jgi:hypothetical protein